MPAPSSPLPTSLSALHLYRHLLREATYLPPAFRPHITSLIRDRARSWRFHDPRRIKHLAKARQTLRTLRAANSGDKSRMQALMWKGFGRTGQRRRDMVEGFAKMPDVKDTKTLEAALDVMAANRPAAAAAAAADKPTATSSTSNEATRKPPRSRKEHVHEKYDQQKLTAIFRSQKKQQTLTARSTSWPGKEFKEIDDSVQVPKTNIWGKPLNPAVVQTKKGKWWQRSIDKVMPPVDQYEWDVLRHLSEGAQENDAWRVPSRRQPAVALSGSDGEAAEPAAHGAEAVEEEDEEWHNLQRYASSRAHRVAGQGSHGKDYFLRTGRKDPTPYGLLERTSEISARWYRRAYSRTFQITPKMDGGDTQAKNYKFEWGSQRDGTPTARAEQLAFFDPDGSSTGKKKGKNKGAAKPQG